MSLVAISLALSRTVSSEAFKIIPGFDDINRCPLGHSYSTPRKIFTVNWVPSKKLY